MRDGKPIATIAKDNTDGSPSTIKKRHEKESSREKKNKSEGAQASLLHSSNIVGASGTTGITENGDGLRNRRSSDKDRDSLLYAIPGGGLYYLPGDEWRTASVDLRGTVDPSGMGEGRGDRPTTDPGNASSRAESRREEVHEGVGRGDALGKDGVSKKSGDRLEERKVLDLWWLTGRKQYEYLRFEP